MDDRERAAQVAEQIAKVANKVSDALDWLVEADDKIATYTNKIVRFGNRLIENLDNEAMKYHQQAQPAPEAPAEGGGTNKPSRTDMIKTVRQFLASKGDTTSVWFSNSDSISDDRVEIAYLLVSQRNKLYEEKVKADRRRQEEFLNKWYNKDAFGGTDH